LSSLGFKSPGEVDLAAIDDNRMSETLSIPMLTAEQTGYEMGREAAKILLARIADPKLPFQQRYLAARLAIHSADTAIAVGVNGDNTPVR
jgi:DNA-binding LacI/PurR family transcriptional regulator